MTTLDKQYQRVFRRSATAHLSHPVTHIQVEARKMRTAAGSFGTVEEVFVHVLNVVAPDLGKPFVTGIPFIEPFRSLEAYTAKVGGFKLEVFDCNQFLGLLPPPQASFPPPSFLLRKKGLKGHKAPQWLNSPPGTDSDSAASSDRVDAPIQIQKSGPQVSFASIGVYVVSSTDGSGTRFGMAIIPQGMGGMVCLLACRSQSLGLDLMAFERWQEQMQEIYYSQFKESRRIHYVNSSSADIPDVKFSDVILPLEMKNDIISGIKSFFNAGGIYKSLRVPWKRGMLFVGSPGNGKSSMIKAIANEMPYPLFGVVARADMSDYHLEDWLRMASASAPSIAFIEDVGRIWKGNSKVSKSAFLNLLDGVSEVNGVLIIGTDNFPQDLDPALIERPSRFDLIYHFPDPEPEVKAELITRLGRGFFSTELIWEIASHSKFSMAMAKEIVMQAFLGAAHEDRSPTDRDLKKAWVSVQRNFGDRKAKQQ